MRAKFVDSVHNPTLKWIRKVCSDPKKERLIVFEGEHLLEEALRSEFSFKTILLTKEKYEKWCARLDGLEAVVVEEEVFGSVSMNRSPEGVMALGTIGGGVIGIPGPSSAYLYLDRVQDPVNVGILVRTAYALSYDGVLVGKGSADPFNPTALARSAGAAFHVPVNVVREDEFLGWAEMNGVTVVSAQADGTAVQEISGPVSPFVIVLGNESGGISANIMQRSGLKAAIPMRKGWDSLNVSSAGSILMYALKYLKT